MKESNLAYALKNPALAQKFLSADFIRSHFIPMLRAAWALRRATHVGKMTRVWGRPVIHNQGTLWIGERVRLISTITPLELAVEGGVLEIQDGAYINYGCSIAAMQRVQIGKNCLIGTYVMITDNNFHRLEPERRNERPESQPVILEDNVWLGGHVIVLPGVTIGAGSAVGAGSVVTRSIPSRCVAVGVPARVVKQL